MKINQNLAALPAGYLFAEIAKRVKEYSAAHPDADILRLGIGDVTLPLVPAVVDAMKAAADEMGTLSGFHGYGPDFGYDWLIDAIIAGDYASRGIEMGRDEVFVSDGAKSDVGNLQELFGPDAKIAVTDPVYPVYVDSNAMAGRLGAYENGKWTNLNYLPCTAENGFVPPLPKDDIDVVYLCYPNNPTGTVLTKEQLKVFVDWALRHNALIVYDAAYKAFISGPDVPRSIYEIPGAKKCAIECCSFSKTAGFTGTRCAYTVVLAYPGSWYAGLMDGEYNPRVHAPAYRKAYYTKFDREGLGFMPTINQNDIILPPGSITRDKIEDGSLHASPFSIFDDGRPNPGGWHGTPPNFNVAHPDVQAALERAVDAFISEGRVHPSFKGVVLHLTRHSLSWFGDERAGYNDYAVEAFARAKGLTIPVDRNDPMRGKGYADWIRANAYDAWLDWRCGVVADLYRRLAAKLRAARPDLKLMVNTFLLPDWRHPDFGKENFIPEANRRAGLDVRLLADVPNLIVCQTEIPADYRWFGPMNPSDPKDNGRWREFRATAEPAHRNLYFKKGDYALLDGEAFPWVNQHDRYWESAIGRITKDQPGKTLSCAWLKECPWRVTTINPSGRHALKHYAVPFRYHDVLGLSKGGFLIGTYGTEDVLVPFIQAFRALPAVVFDDVGGAADSLVKVRQKEFGGKSYFYAINTSEKPTRVTLKVPPGTEDLVTKARLAPDGAPQAVTLDLQAYELRAFMSFSGQTCERIAK